ncbi:tetratricopeptide repeat protein [Flavobacterium sp. 3HN19-14]|uniref:tetratricopeptide repeat protein n=1 Tax=Flavobacterium sp. 3HN19-14 TaxID=3448133 RepID=UPI003EDF1653
MKKSAVLFFVMLLVHLSWSQTKTAIDSVNGIPFEVKIAKAASLTSVFLKNAGDAQKINYKSELADSYSNLSLVYYYLGKYDENVAYSLKAIKIYEQTNQQEKLAGQYGELGYMMKRRNMAKAQEYMLVGMRISEKRKFNVALMKIYDNYGVLKEMQNQLDSALFFYNKALSMKEAGKDSLGIPYSLNNIAGIYLMREQYAAAKPIYEKVLKIRQSLNAHIGIAETYTSLGDLYAMQQNHNEAIVWYKKALDIATQFSYINLMVNSHKMLSEQYELLGNGNEAFRNYKLYAQFKDSLLNKDTNTKIAELEVEFETNKRKSNSQRTKTSCCRKTSRCANRDFY